jgi:hypothetical protein
MKTYYVATLARYVLVDADTDTEARSLGHAALHDLYADVRQRLGREVPTDIVTVREASADEIELCDWHHRQVEGEGQPLQGLHAPATASGSSRWRMIPIPSSRDRSGPLSVCRVTDAATTPGTRSTWRGTTAAG